VNLPVRQLRGRITTVKRDAPVRARLFCFPYAGAGAAVFRQWADDLPSDVELCIPCLPGRDARQDEPPATDMVVLATELAEGLRPLTDRPYALFGHSMGAFIAFDLAQALAAAGAAPSLLFASAQRGPRLPYPGRPIFDLPNPEFLTAVRERYQAIPEPLLRQPEMMDILLRRLRGDFTLVEDYRYRAQGPLSCPIIALGGLEDPLIGKSQLEAWSLETTARFDLQRLPGGHFYINEARPALLAVIRAHLDGLAQS